MDDEIWNRNPMSEDDSKLLHEISGKLDLMIISMNRHYDENERDFLDARKMIVEVGNKTNCIRGDNFAPRWQRHAAHSWV